MYLISLFLFLLVLHPPRSTLFPYTTLFRSRNYNFMHIFMMIGLYTYVHRSKWMMKRDRKNNENFSPWVPWWILPHGNIDRDRKSTRLNSSHPSISYAVFCLKKKNNKKQINT